MAGSSDTYHEPLDKLIFDHPRHAPGAGLSAGGIRGG